MTGRRRSLCVRGAWAAVACLLAIALAPAPSRAADVSVPPERPASAPGATQAPTPAPEPAAVAPAPAGGRAAGPFPTPPDASAGEARDLLSGGWANPPVLVFTDFSWWWDAPATPAAAARLFDQICLATLPDFAGAGMLFDYLGFIGVPGMRIRNHVQKKMSALAMTPADLDASGARSCAVLAEGFEPSRTAGAVAPIVGARFGAVPRHDVPTGGVRHVLWTVETTAGPARISVTESGGDVHIGATVLPRAGSAEPVTSVAR